MDIHIGDLLTLKKPHPCGGRVWEVTRVGADFKLRCSTCGREVMRPRSEVERAIKLVTRDGEEIRMDHR